MQTTGIQSTISELINEGNRLRQEGKLDQAISSFRQAIQLDETAYEAYHFLGEVLAQQDKLEDAVETYQRAIKINPDYVWSYHCLKQVLFWQGKYAQAIATSKQAVNLDPSKAAFFYQLGLSLAAQGYLEHAIIAFKKTLQLDPDFIAAVEELSRLESMVLGNSSDPAIEEIQSTIEGYLDEVDGCLLKGWVWDSAQPAKSLNLIVFVGEQELFRFTSDGYREDLEKAGIGSGYYGFALKLPLEIYKHLPCKIEIQVENKNIELNNSPVVIEKQYIIKQLSENIQEKLDVIQQIANILA